MVEWFEFLLVEVLFPCGGDDGGFFAFDDGDWFFVVCGEEVFSEEALVEVVGAGVFPVASSDLVREIAAGRDFNVADKAFLVTCRAWVLCAALFEYVAVLYQQKPPLTSLHGEPSCSASTTIPKSFQITNDFILKNKIEFPIFSLVQLHFCREILNTLKFTFGNLFLAQVDEFQKKPEFQSLLRKKEWTWQQFEEFFA